MRMNGDGVLVAGLLGTALSAEAAPSCHEPYQIFGSWRDRAGQVAVHFSADEIDPYVGRALAADGRPPRDGHPMIVMFEERVEADAGERLFSGELDLPGDQSPRLLKVRLVTDVATRDNRMHLQLRRERAWYNAHELACAEPR